MAGLFVYSLAGTGFLFLAAVESLLPSHPSLRFISAFLLSLLVIIDSLISTFSSSSHDTLGVSLPLSTISACSLFLLYAVSGLLSLYSLLPLPASFLDLLLLSAFSQELLLLHLPSDKDPDALERRYFNLLLVPVLACAVSTLLSLVRPYHPGPRLARAAALALHGTWLIQMGFSLFSTVIAHGCSLRRLSRANYTVQCRGHAESHRASAIATLQFNCHLAFLVVVGAAVYSVVAASAGRSGSPGYRPLNKELQRMDHISTSRFTLDSDDEDEENVAVAVAPAENGPKQQSEILEVNGFHGSH